MDLTTVQTAVCKSLQSIGLNPRKEHQIENAIAIQIRSSGPEFLLGRLSDLTDWRKMHMKGDTFYHPEWHAYKSRKGNCTPADSIGSQLWGLSDKAFFATVGALRKSVILAVPTEKQLSKWLEGVRCENKSDPNCRLGFKLSRRCCDRLEKQLEREWAGREWFNVTDISGTNIPGSGKFMTVKVDKDTCKKDPLSLLSAYGFTISTTPLFVWQFLKDIDAPTRMGEGVDCPDKLVDSLSKIIDAKLADYKLADEAEMGSSFVDDEHYYAARAYKNAVFGFQHSVGNIGFLEQPSGKLRTVANPNRLVQYVNRPLGEVLSRMFYHDDGYYVMNQNEGMKWAQDKLRQGISLSSFDMSSATDRLDYRKFLHEFFSTVYAEPDQFRLLSRSLELFEDTSESNWTIPGHIADLCGMTGNEIGWTVGQPLGLRPSFPILTIMNASFAQSAIRAVDGGLFTHGHFACVGDDLIIETKYAKAYMEKVTGFNGKINNDKTMESDRYAEFCSHMITRSSYYPLKPRFISELEGSLQNVDKFTTSGLHPVVPSWVRDLHDLQARYYLEGFNTIKYSNSTIPATLMERIGVNTLIEAIKPASRDSEKVTLQTLYMRAEQERESLGMMPRAKELSTSYASSAYPKFGGNEAQPNVKVSYKAVETQSDYGTLGEVSTDQSTSVELPIKKEWDFRKASYSRPTSELNQAKQVVKTLGKIDTFTVGPLVESKTVVKGIETTILVDMSSDTPEISLHHRPITANDSVEDNTKTGHTVCSPESKISGDLPKLLKKYKKDYYDLD